MGRRRGPREDNLSETLQNLCEILIKKTKCIFFYFVIIVVVESSSSLLQWLFFWLTLRVYGLGVTVLKVCSSSGWLADDA